MGPAELETEDDSRGFRQTLGCMLGFVIGVVLFVFAQREIWSSSAAENQHMQSTFLYVLFAVFAMSYGIYCVRSSISENCRDSCCPPTRVYTLV